MLSENSNVVCRIRREHRVAAVSFAAMTAVTLTAAGLREIWALPSGAWGVTLIVWVLTGVAWIVTRYVMSIVEVQTRQAKQIKRLTEATKVTGWSAAMDEDTNVRHINRR